MGKHTARRLGTWLEMFGLGIMWCLLLHCVQYGGRQSHHKLGFTFSIGTRLPLMGLQYPLCLMGSLGKCALTASNTNPPSNFHPFTHGTKFA